MANRSFLEIAPESAKSISALQHDPIFVGGAGRSGTTLVRVILDSHSKITCGPELKVTPIIAELWKDFQTKYIGFLKSFEVDSAHVNLLFRNFVSGLLEPLRIKSGKTRVAEKSPNNIFYFEHLHRIFPDGNFIHVVRDCRDVVASLLKMDWKTPDGRPIPYTQNAEAAAKYWLSAIDAGRRFQAQNIPNRRYLEIRYEDLVNTPEQTTKRLFDFLGEPWEEQVLDFHRLPRDLGRESSAGQVEQKLYQSSVSRWKDDLNQNDLNAIYQIAGARLRDLGYA